MADTVVPFVGVSRCMRWPATTFLVVAAPETPHWPEVALRGVRELGAFLEAKRAQIASEPFGLPVVDNPRRVDETSWIRP